MTTNKSPSECKEQVTRIIARWRASLAAADVQTLTHALHLAIIDDMRHGADAAQGWAMCDAIEESQELPPPRRK